MWRPIEQYGVRRLLAAVLLFAVSFLAFRVGFTHEDVAVALTAISVGGIAAALAVGSLTMTQPWRMLAVGALVTVAMGSLLGVSAALYFYFFDFKIGP